MTYLYISWIIEVGLNILLDTIEVSEIGLSNIEINPSQIRSVNRTDHRWFHPKIWPVPGFFVRKLSNFICNLQLSAARY